MKRFEILETATAVVCYSLLRENNLMEVIIMTRTITELGTREAAFLATFASSGKSVFTFDEAVGFWGSVQYTRNVLSHLVDKGWVERVERGSYLIIPLEAGPDRLWSEDPLVLGTLLAPNGGAAYWTAARHWGWTTQLPRVAFFISPKRRHNPRPTIMGIDFRFITLKPKRIFGIEEEWNAGLRLRVTDPERTIADTMNRPDLSGGIAEVSEMLRQAWAQLDLALLTEYLRRFGSGTAPKRLGFLVERLGLPDASQWLPRWHGMIGTGFTALERGGASDGKLLRAWNLRLNAAGFESEDMR
ncbi:MAG: type IV toxin-antitoxin system AbiEi family antitoxin domain-containing protein [Coriobacteriia bacterium]